MKLVADENIDGQIVAALRSDGHDVSYIAELEPGVDDATVLAGSFLTNTILLTADKDFGELVFRQRRAASGVLLVRLQGLSSGAKASLVVETFRQRGQTLLGAFAVLAPGTLRIRRGMR